MNYSEELRARAAKTANATTALELRVSALEWENAELAKRLEKLESAATPAPAPDNASA